MSEFTQIRRRGGRATLWVLAAAMAICAVCSPAVGGEGADDPPTIIRPGDPDAPMTPPADQRDAAAGGAEDAGGAGGSGEKTFRVATFNINFWNRDLEEIVKTIARADADLIALQEVNAKSVRRMRARFAGKYPHMEFRPGNGASGFAWMSVGPLERLRWLPPEHGLFGTWIATVELAGRAVQVVNVHLHPTLGQEGLGEFLAVFPRAERTRVREFGRIQEAIDDETPTILLGDFNSTPEFDVLERVADAGYVDSFAAAVDEPRDHPTWQVGRWKFRIDYVFHTDQFETTDSEVLTAEASDHHLVVSTLQWADAAAPAAAPAPNAAEDVDAAPAGPQDVIAPEPLDDDESADVPRGPTSRTYPRPQSPHTRNERRS